jgi:hypothetical protein
MGAPCQQIVIAGEMNVKLETREERGKREGKAEGRGSRNKEQKE